MVISSTRTCFPSPRQKRPTSEPATDSPLILSGCFRASAAQVRILHSEQGRACFGRIHSSPSSPAGLTRGSIFLRKEMDCTRTRACRARACVKRAPSRVKPDLLCQARQCRRIGSIRPRPALVRRLRGSNISSTSSTSPHPEERALSRARLRTRSVDVAFPIQYDWFHGIDPLAAEQHERIQEAAYVGVGDRANGTERDERIVVQSKHSVDGIEVQLG